MTNADVARVFNEIADLMEIKGEDGFRISSYRRVARTIEDLAGEIGEIASRGELESLAGIGKSSAAKIQELLATGKIGLREELAGEVPATLLELLRIPHLGPKKAALLWKERGITSLDGLKKCLDAGGLEELKGLGAKSVAQIREGIAFLAAVGGRTRLGVATAVADLYRAYVAAMPGVSRVEHAGSLRRGAETVGDLDLLCIADDGGAVVARFVKLPNVKQVLAAGDTKGSILVEYRPGKSIQIDLRVVPAESFGAAWQYFTGSKQHNVRLRERAVKRGWSLNEYALTEETRVIASKTEEEIYKALDVPWIPPELREDRGELELKATPRDLLKLEHIRGDLHMHTTASDGKATIDEMIAAAQRRGYEYLCITDHSQSSVIANGLRPDRLLKHLADVRRAAAKTRGITVWVGAEVDILADGRLDYADEILAQLDFVVASVHAGMGKDIEANTRRTLAAIANPHVNLIAHPTGRLINKRDAMPLDIEAIAKAAAKNGTALEINASEYRLDLKDVHARLARDLGVTICIDTDSHAVDQLDQMRFGVTTARRAGLRAADVLNTRDAAGVTAFVAAKRGDGVKGPGPRSPAKRARPTSRKRA